MNLDQYLLHVGIAHGLRNTFALVVAGPGSYGVHVAPVVLSLRVDLRIYEKARDNETSLFLPHAAPSSLLGTMSIYDGPRKPFTTETCSREAVLWAPGSQFQALWHSLCLSSLGGNPHMKKQRLRVSYFCCPSVP